VPIDIEIGEYNFPEMLLQCKGIRLTRKKLEKGSPRWVVRDGTLRIFRTLSILNMAVLLLPNFQHLGYPWACAAIQS